MIMTLLVVPVWFKTKWFCWSIKKIMIERKYHNSCIIITSITNCTTVEQLWTRSCLFCFINTPPGLLQCPICTPIYGDNDIGVQSGNLQHSWQDTQPTSTIIIHHDPFSLSQTSPRIRVKGISVSNHEHPPSSTNTKITGFSHSQCMVPHRTGIDHRVVSGSQCGERR